MSENWKHAVFYQIYPRSFLDTTGNGVGDLKGITQKLEYVAGLGVDGIWISPFFKSPMKDYGYDVSDYRDIDPLFGTLADFDELIAKAHDLDLQIIIDLVLSHTSDQHPWFSDPSKKDWYVWADAKADGSPPNNWVSIFGGSAWEWSAHHHQYYLHNFLREQPDLNFHNPEVQEEALNIMRFWLDRGVDAFRLDVVNFFFHDQQLRNNPPRPKELGAATQFEGDDPYSQQQHIYDKSQPENLEFLSRMRAVMDEYDNRFTVGEIGDDHPYKMAVEYTAGNNRLHTTYNPQMMSGAQKNLTADIIRTPIEEFSTQANTLKGGHPAWAFSNHDVVRAASRWLANSDGFSHNPQCSKMLNALLLTLDGTIFLYQGEELGLPEAKLTFEQLQDPWGIHLWPEWQGRDGCRTPIPWSKSTPQNQWLPVPTSHLQLNAEDQGKDQNSVLNFTRNFLKWRKTQPALTHGTIAFKDTGDDTKLAFTRKHADQTLYCSFDLRNYTYEITEK
jgi:alpha-glucosidase